MADETWLRKPDAVHRGWRYNIAVGPAIARYQALELEMTTEAFKSVRDEMVTAVKAAPDFSDPGLRGQKLRDLAEEMADTDDSDELEFLLSELYDWGDAHRVVIN